MKFHLYAISLMAVQKNAEPVKGETGAMIYWAHEGTVGIFENIVEAGEQNKAEVYRRFPVADGYSLHSVVVTPIGQKFFKALEKVAADGFLDLDIAVNEKTRTFNFDPDAANDFHFDTGGQIH